MQRHTYLNNYKRPSSRSFVGRAWCHWNRQQVMDAGGWNDAQLKMIDIAKKYGYHTYGANYFVETSCDNYDGSAAVELDCYYKT